MNISITIRYGIQSATITRPSGTKIGQIKTDANLRAALGFGDRVNALISGVSMPDDAIISDGTDISIETACNTKASQQTVTIRYGIQEYIAVYDIPVTVGMVKGDPRAKAILGFGDRVNALVSGVAMPDDAILAHESIVVIETACNTKANG